MSDLISLASGLLALSTFAFKASVTLFETVQSFKSHSSRVSELLEELEALSGVLGPLAERVETGDFGLSTLKLPLLRCGRSCEEFEQELIKCSQRAGGGRTSFRDWARLRYLGEDIDGFRRQLAGYKLTINIALTDASLRQSSATAERLDGYRDLIKGAQTNLEDRLESIDEKLELFFGQTVAESDSDTLEVQLIKEERLSTEKCLQICAQLSTTIDQIQVSSNRDGRPSELLETDSLSESATNNCLADCKNNLLLTSAKLEKHMRDLTNRLLAKSKASMTSEEDIADLARLHDEWETTRQCMDICSRAGQNLQENVSKIDNYATGDAVQFMVSTNGKVIHGKNRGLGWRSRQVGGYLDNDTVKQLSRDMASYGVRNTENHQDLPSRGNIPRAPNDGAEDTHASEYEKLYGHGFKLTSTASPSPMSFTDKAQSGRSGPMR
ncbi:hypothetical protein MGYG_05322 [Nannizzia gypsea CBS 118893]|uniref:Azaphilone pigments biosynthesis cluster protein L N-terminal domain-containing protein n=1 Tax=Arthroderma gypseum (strain ATCC MYA-4604 / CBS 118893) TaxID=535722 RepID=E4UVJ8_ARTGP|nr:hypothetical protein MGYG_05322 [Nannizzia gypsea CBS 118893]EFR02325.1 hypothetical protein MGYG_05322 [Nannizzia gypsea CBS 118893]